MTEPSIPDRVHQFHTQPPYLQTQSLFMALQTVRVDQKNFTVFSLIFEKMYVQGIIFKGRSDLYKCLLKYHFNDTTSKSQQAATFFQINK